MSDPKPAQFADYVATAWDEEACKRALDALKIQNAITDLARRYDPRLVMETARNWLDYMDRQVARIDGSEGVLCHCACHWSALRPEDDHCCPTPAHSDGTMSDPGTEQVRGS